MNIGIGLKRHAYTPEAYAYKSYLEARGFSVSLVSDASFSDKFDIFIRYMGFFPVWSCENTRAEIEIHEYQSLSIPPFSTIKDLVKSKLNRRPEGRIFLNSFVKDNLCLNDDVPFIYSDMGVDSSLFTVPDIVPEYDLVYSGSLSNRVGLLEQLLRLARMGFKILIIGEFSDDFAGHFSPFKGVSLLGRVDRKDLPFLYRKARAGLNFTPDLFPFNIQTSTKTLEYCAAGLGVVSNNYAWVSDFCDARSARFQWLADINDIDDFHRFNFIVPDVSDLSWDILLDRSGLYEFLKSFAL